VPSAGSASPSAGLCPVETAVRGVFADVVGVPVTDPTADLFSLGGHSLQATRIASMLSERLGVDFSVTDFFKDPSPFGVNTGIHERYEGACPSCPNPDPP
jgi:acyl carrier protein